MEIWNPVGGETFDTVLAHAALTAAPRVLDVGCGPAGLLVRTLRAHEAASAVAVDRAEAVVARARDAIAAAGMATRVELRCEPFDPARFAPGSFDLVLCVGASHAAGGPAGAPHALAPLLRPGGFLLLGEGYWEREPDPGYLALLGATRDAYGGLDEVTGPGRAAGLAPGAVVPCSRGDWDRYEDGYAANVERFVATHPADPDAAAMLARIRPWREGYLRWGRTTLGFALALLRRPGGL